MRPRLSHTWFYIGDKLEHSSWYISDAGICKCLRRWPEITHLISINTHGSKVKRIRTATSTAFRRRHDAYYKG